MLRVKIELVPHGDESRAKPIGEMVIANSGRTGCDYEAWTDKDSWSGEPERFGRLDNYDRSQSVWELVRLLLEAIRLETHEPDTKKDSLSQRLKSRLGLLKGDK